MINRFKDNKPTQRFDPIISSFARTIHYCAPFAYSTLKIFLPWLPAISTITRWNRTSDYEPGIHEKILEYVSQLSKQERKKGKNLVFNLTFDEVHLKQREIWNPNSSKWIGCTDYGGDFQEKASKKGPNLAKKALVFMLVAINGGFKTSVAYYLCNSTDGEDRSVLLKNVLVKLHEKDIDVRGLTFDGDKANVKACEKLGANFNYVKQGTSNPYINHPVTSKRIYIYFLMHATC